MACCAYLFVLLCGTHWPGEPITPTIAIWDKLLHFAAYATLAFLFLLGIQRHPSRSQLFFFCAAALALWVIGGFDELTQWPVPGRYPDPFDWLADGMGIVSGVMLFTARNGVSQRP